MPEWTEVFSGTFEFKEIFGIAIIGWLIGVGATLYRFDRGKDRLFLGLANDLVNKTFVAITFTAALTIAINVSFYIPPLSDRVDELLADNASLVDENERLQTLLTDLEREIGALRTTNSDLAGQNVALSNELARLAELLSRPQTVVPFAQQLMALENNPDFLALAETLAANVIGQVGDGHVYIRGAAGTIHCGWDGRWGCTIE